MEKWKARVRKNKNDDERRYKVPRWVENRKAIYAKLEASRQVENLGKVRDYT